MEYREVVKVKYNNKLFQMLLSDSGSRYFLEVVSDGELQYPTLSDLIGLECIFTDNSDIYLIEDGKQKKKRHIIPKVIMGGLAIPLSLTLIINGCSTQGLDEKKQHEIQTDLGFVVEDRLTDLEIETYKQNDQFNYEYVYDVAYLDNLLPNKNISETDLLNVIDNNKLVSDKFRKYLKEYVRLYCLAYPSADRRVLYENFKDIEVVECADKRELISHTYSYDSYACYMKNENKIYVIKDYEYQKGTWEYQVIMHELSHAASTYWRDTDNDSRYDKRVQFEGLVANQTVVMEAINTLFTIYMMDYFDNNFAYQLQSNMFDTILDSVDNWSLPDYINHSSSYFANKLDEYLGYNNYAEVMFKVIDAQYKDFHSENIEIEESEYYPLYEWISDIYYKDRLNSSMGYDQLLAVCDELVGRITYDVAEEYHLDSTYFYQYFEEYIRSHNYVTSVSR